MSKIKINIESINDAMDHRYMARYVNWSTIFNYTFLTIYSEIRIEIHLLLL